MASYTKLLQFKEKTCLTIMERDKMCFFCKRRYHMENKTPMSYQVHDIMHVVNKSQLGLGIEQNGVLGCRYHHGLLDNGNRGLREEMVSMLEAYLKTIYNDWSREQVTYKKFGVLPF